MSIWTLTPPNIVKSKCSSTVKGKLEVTKNHVIELPKPCDDPNNFSHHNLAIPKNFIICDLKKNSSSDDKF
jgi:hypothetical protein